jgi:hypothetical protein
MSKLFTGAPLAMTAPWAMLHRGPIPAASLDAELALLYRTGGNGGLACMQSPSQWMLDRLAAGRSVFVVE